MSHKLHIYADYKKNYEYIITAEAEKGQEKGNKDNPYMDHP